jgi:hypothetical protein
VYYTDSVSVGWMIFRDGPVVHGQRKYPFPIERKYSVVVSPDQHWVAYATPSKIAGRYDLRLSRLRYKPASVPN